MTDNALLGDAKKRSWFPDIDIDTHLYTSTSTSIDIDTCFVPVWLKSHLLPHHQILWNVKYKQSKCIHSHNTSGYYPNCSVYFPCSKTCYMLERTSYKDYTVSKSLFGQMIKVSSPPQHCTDSSVADSFVISHFVCFGIPQVINGFVHIFAKINSIMPLCVLAKLSATKYTWKGMLLRWSVG